MALHCFCDKRPLSAYFLHFSRHIKNRIFVSKNLLQKDTFRSKKMVPYVIKSSKDSKNGVKCYPWHLHQVLLEYPPKICNKQISKLAQWNHSRCTSN